MGLGSSICKIRNLDEMYSEILKSKPVFLSILEELLKTQSHSWPWCPILDHSNYFFVAVVRYFIKGRVSLVPEEESIMAGREACQRSLEQEAERSQSCG